MNAQVFKFTGVTRLDVNPDDVLKEAIGLLPGGVVIMGYDADDNEFFASSIADGGSVNWLIDRMKMKLLQAMEE